MNTSSMLTTWCRHVENVYWRWLQASDKELVEETCEAD